MNTDQQEVFVCSDPHINHKNLIEGCSNWNDKSGCRPFKNREEHNWAIINGINNNVGEDDILYCLGDWYFGGLSSVWWFRKQLKVKDIRLIYGNHDNGIEDNKILPNVVRDITTDKLEDSPEGYIPGQYVSVSAQELFTWCKYYAKVKHWGHTYILLHYALDVWDKRHHGNMHLFGHSHNSLADRGDRRMDVGFESAYEILGEWRPFNIKECQSILQSRTNKPLDHHNKNTNE